MELEIFMSTLVVGAVAGWVAEQQVGPNLLRWARQRRMQMRVLRRRGDNPRKAWSDQDDE